MDIVNPRHIAFNLFVTLFTYYLFFTNSRTLSCTTYISVVIDCIFSKKV